MEEELFACHRGCRLFSICQFANEGDDLNKTKTECESACTEAYPQSSEQYACILGCHSQMPFAEKRQEELSDMMPRIHILFPLTMVRAFWSDMMDSTQNFMSSSWTFFIQADNGRILVVQSPPEIQQMPPLQAEEPSARGNMLDAMSSNFRGRNSVGEGRWSRRADVLELDGGEGIMKCFSMNSNWLLTATLLLSVLVLLWICCATVATASDQYIPSEVEIPGTVEPLAAALRRSDEMTGFKYGVIEERMALYADDILLFLADPVASLEGAIGIIERFGSVSGLRINWSKSILFKVDDVDWEPLEDGRLEVTSKFKYLGIWVSMPVTDYIHENLTPILGALKAKADAWLKLHLSVKLSIYGDLEYLNEQKLHKYPPASLVVVHGLPQENEDAGPLPTKVDLAKSAI
ncbi:unnamed protein product [Ranitomeya imitator]|uniref:Transmembrane protein 59 n=1 Tax=Ranitomeya imitator TaxID=111125 RepID=A0ABN9LSI8_9NEOB|nr:unnamed protein product [Ranitomeya imitator]